MTPSNMPRSNNHPRRTSFLTVFLLALLTLLAVPGLQAIEVTTTADENGGNPGACALREAVRTISSQSSFGGCPFNAGDSVIELGAETYQLSLNVGVSDRVDIKKPMTLSGQGPGLTIIERSGAFDDDMLFVNVNEPGNVTLEGFTLRGAIGRFNSAIDFLAETGLELVLRDMAFRDNDTETGAPFRIQGDGDSPVHVERVIFEDNRNFGTFADGGGIDCSASETSAKPSLHLLDVIFRNNKVETTTSSGFGGGISSVGCDLELQNVTFVGNTVVTTSGVSAGGGLMLFAGDNPNTVTLENVTFFGNSAGIAGGLGQGEDSTATLSLTMSNVTFAGNVASVTGDHFYQDSGETSLRNVLFGPSPSGGCASTTAPVITLLGGNMDADGTCGVERTEPDPGLALALVSLDGFTPVLPLAGGAVAIDAGTNAGCPATDQRGAARPFDGDGDLLPFCDVGAFEVSSSEIFFDGFESGGTEAWSFTTP